MPKISLPTRTASLFRNGRNQAIRIPREMELPGKEVLLYREGSRLIVEPKAKSFRLMETLEQLKPLDIRLPNVDRGMKDLDQPEI